jgi:hypothetical protein
MLHGCRPPGRHGRWRATAESDCERQPLRDIAAPRAAISRRPARISESAEGAAGGTPLVEMTPRSVVCAALVIAIAFVVPTVVAEVVSGDNARRADGAAQPAAVATALRPRDEVVEIRDFRSAATLPDLAANRLPRAPQLPVAPEPGSGAPATVSVGAAEPPSQAAPSRADRFATLLAASRRAESLARVGRLHARGRRDRSQLEAPVAADARIRLQARVGQPRSRASRRDDLRGMARWLSSTPFESRNQRS